MIKIFREKDLLWFAFIAIAILEFSSIPYFIGRSSETDEWRFKGIYFDTEDYAVHLSMMQAGRLGDWAYQLRFTDEAHSPAYLRLFYVVLGHISNWTGLSAESTYQLARWVLGLTALFFIYKICQRFLPNKNQARTAFLLSVMGAGVGWLMLLLGVPLKPISPIDFWLVDAYIFFSISLFPSFSFSLILMALAMNLFFDFLETGKWKSVFWVCFLAVLSQTTNPISFAVVDAAFAGAVLSLWWKNHKVKPPHLTALAGIALSQIPLLVYNFLVLSRAPVWSQFTNQNLTPSPPIGFYLLGFAPFLLFVPYAVYRAIRERTPNLLALMFWILAGFSLAYLPVAIQRRFLLGITIPLGILAVHGMGRLIRRVPFLLKRENLVYFTFVLFSSISTMYLVLGLSIFLKTLPGERFYPRELDDAFLWLNENATSNEFVLADTTTSQLVAQKTRLKVYVGHEMETLLFNEKKLEMQSFFKGTQSPDWLSQTQIRWVIFGPYERKFTDTFTLPANLELRYDKNDVQIYRVIPQ